MEVGPEDSSLSLASIFEARLSVVSAESDARNGNTDRRDSVKDISLRFAFGLSRKKVMYVRS